MGHDVMNLLYLQCEISYFMLCPGEVGVIYYAFLPHNHMQILYFETLCHIYMFLFNFFLLFYFLVHYINTFTTDVLSVLIGTSDFCRYVESQYKNLA